MNLKRHILWAAMSLPLAAAAQEITFESGDYKAIGTYDSWEESPFRTGALKGNAAVVSNHLSQVNETLGFAPNATEHILGFQRSRFGSNLYGARIDLDETFELTKTTKYVHVMIHKPTDGRMMLIGLGKRRERAGQSPEAEQFWALSSLPATPGEWCDAVFPIKGAGGIDIYSLVVVPDCESPHALTSDYAVYIDEIVVNDSPTPRFRLGDYVINYDESTTVNRSERKFTGITLKGSADGDQSMNWGTLNPTPIHYTLLDKSFTAKAGETLTPAFGYTSNWLNGYVYLDRGNDGKFEAELADDYTIPEGSDLMTYAYVETVANTEGYFSDGTKVTGSSRNVLNPPAFTVPADLPNGYYRIRFKLDWGNVDPGGSTTIVADGGMIFDTRLNVHGDFCPVTSANRNGDVLTEDGAALNGYQAPFGQPLTVKMAPEEGFTYEGIRVRYGYNLAGDSLVHGTPQYVDVVYPAYLFRDDKFTIPAEIMTANVQVEGLFTEINGETPETGNDYPLNFDKDLTIERTDRRLNRITITGTTGGTKAIRIDDDGTNHVYRNMTNKEISLVPGDQVTTAIDYTGNAMHEYLYIDFNQDGQFNTSLDASGVPTLSGELVSYTYYDGKNSLGQAITGTPGSVRLDSMPAFTLPAALPTGVYRARLKVDWNNIDPAGQWSEGGANQIDANGGYVVDFLVNVHNAEHKLELHSENGSIYGLNNTGLPLTIPCFESLRIVPTAVASGYQADSMTIRHGHNFDGPQYVRGNRQWSEFKTRARAYTIPQDSINGDVAVYVSYEPTDRAAYKLIFADEFNGPDGSQPDAEVWHRCPRENATWSRWLSDSEDVIYISDGKLVARAIPNPDQESDPVPMITGGVESSGLFDFLYGKIEARILTHPHSGNFPAFWLMPTDQSKGWPNDGEIDIWEQIDAQNTAYHTVHSNWTYNLGNKNNPKSSYNESVEMDRYHTYGLEWDERSLRWYVDGKQVGSYAKSTDADALSKGQWPFDKAFFIILNQSVGNGSWAANADVSHTYETLFDWVRVYQIGSPEVGIDDITEKPAFSVSASHGQIHISCDRPSPVSVFDASGRTVWHGTVQAKRDIPVAGGIYIVAGTKVLVP